MDLSKAVLFTAFVLFSIWGFLFFSLLGEDSAPSTPKTTALSQPSSVVAQPSLSLSTARTAPPKREHLRAAPKTTDTVPLARAMRLSRAVRSIDRDTLTRTLVEKRLSLPRRYTPTPLVLPPPPVEEVGRNMSLYLHTLHSALADMAGPTVNPLEVWETFLDITKRMPMAWDEANRARFPNPRKDGSIFVSLGTYRDPYCPMTLKSLYAQAGKPENVFVGLFQQNCFGPKCRTGVLKGGRVEDAGPDLDCYKEFCASQEGINSGACLNEHVHLFNVNESESLGPYMARYLGGKFYRGEQYYLQIDSHSEFVRDWDLKLIKMIADAPAERPVISTYPPDSTQNWRDSIGFRMCDSEFAAAQIEWQIIRLGSSLPFDRKFLDRPAYAPFVAAGFFFAPAEFLKEVPFDPFLPWIFMGEEISMSVRLWTAGYDIFSPTVNVLNHYYVRRHYPKFWESVNRFFKKPIHNDLVEIVIKRVKSMLGYPESHPDLIHPQSVLYRLSDWSMGKRRPASKYFEMVGLNMNTKRATTNMWCHQAQWPEIASKYKIA